MDHFAGLDVSVKETSVCILRAASRTRIPFVILQTSAPRVAPLHPSTQARCVSPISKPSAREPASLS
jgi:hypothetical protein